LTWRRGKFSHGKTVAPNLVDECAGMPAADECHFTAAVAQSLGKSGAARDMAGAD
jgi:hypothetical protein